MNRNPSGKNQHPAIPKADDPALIAALNKFHREKLTNNARISARLKREYNLELSATSVKRRRQQLGLTGSGVTTRSMPEKQAEQLVLDAMAKDPSRRQGVQTIQHKIAHQTGTHLTRDFVSRVMHIHDPEGFKLREPTGKRSAFFTKHARDIPQ